MNPKRLLGLGLVASSFYFLWVFALAGVLVVYGLLSGGGPGAVDFAGDGPYNLVFTNVLPGAALLAGGIYVLKRSTLTR